MSKRNYKKQVYLRADGSGQIGFGHLMRLLALAEILNDKGFACTFICRNIDDSAYQFFLEPFKVLQVPQQINYTEEPRWMHERLNSGSIIVLDGYQFDSEYQRQVKEGDRFLLVAVDDLNRGYFHADVVINHSGEFKTSDYLAEGNTKILLGPDYAILRKPFLEFAKKSNDDQNRRGCFISFGGADPEHLTEKAISASLEAGFQQIDVILPLRLQKEDMVAFYNNTSKINCFKNISAGDILHLMAKSQVGICSSSTLAYEACCARLCLITGFYVDNQRGINQTLKEAGCCVSLDDFKEAGVEGIKQAIKLADRELIKRNQEKVFHGRSGENLSHVFLELMRAYH